MEGRGAAIRVGAFLLAAIVVILALVWFLRGGQVNNGAQFVTYFAESVQGLQVGSQVQYRGVTVGRVTELGVVSAIHGTEQDDVLSPLYRQVFVRYVVDTDRIGKFPSIDDAVRLGLRARLNSSLITGIAYIDLDFVTPKDHPVPKLPWVPRGDFVPSVPSTLAQVQNAGQKLVAKLDKVDIAGLIDSLNTLSKNLNAELTGGDLHRTLGAATKLLTTADQSVAKADLPGLSADFKKVAAQLSAVATSPDLKQLLSNGALATGRLGKLTEQMSKLVGALD
ncbi:MAG: MlaD family protein, partial [Trebonia sp.]